MWKLYSSRSRARKRLEFLNHPSQSFRGILWAVCHTLNVQMKTEKEIRELKEKLENSFKELDDAGFITLTEKGGHWLDCFEWILE